MASGNGKPKGKRKPTNGTPKHPPSLKGRDSAGKFVKGEYGGGPGNPWAQASHNLKSALIAISESESTKDGIRTKADELAGILWGMALGSGADAFGVKGNAGADPYDRTKVAQRWAIGELYSRMCGKPKEHVELTGEFTLAEAAKEIRELRRVG